MKAFIVSSSIVVLSKVRCDFFFFFFFFFVCVLGWNFSFDSLASWLVRRIIVTIICTVTFFFYSSFSHWFLSDFYFDRWFIAFFLSLWIGRYTKFVSIKFNFFFFIITKKILMHINFFKTFKKNDIECFD